MEKLAELLGYIFFAVALNMDSLGVGFSYGLRRIRIRFISVFFISLISMAVIIFSMIAGQQISKIIPIEGAIRFGGIILVAIGIIALYRCFRQEKNIFDPSPSMEMSTNPESITEIKLFSIKIFGLIFQILRKPHKADIDMSGTISFRESLPLGIALAMDSLVAGVAASLIGYSIIITALFVGIGQLVLIYIGLSLGKGLSTNFFGRKLSFVPSLILIILGTKKML